MRKLTFALSTAALALAGAAFAQNAAAPAHAPKPDMTRAGAQAKAEAAFARMDANKDGIVDQADRAARGATMFERMDADKNGSISRAEFDAMHAKRGDAGMGEMKRGEHHGMMGDKMGGMMGHEMGGMMGDEMGMAAGPLTRQAFVDRALARFDKADTNRDGTVTQAERKAAHDTMREQGQAKRKQS